MLARRANWSFAILIFDIVFPVLLIFVRRNARQLLSVGLLRDA